MKPSSAKGKGRRLQNFLKEKIYDYFPTLRNGDVKTAVMGESGEDIILSPAARDLIPFSFECKNQETLPLWKSLAQAEENCNGRDPILVIKRNRSEVYAVIQFNVFTKLIGETNVKIQEGNS